MFHYKTTTYEKMEKTKPEKKFKQNSYEEIRKIVEENDVERQEINSIVKNKNTKFIVAYANKNKKKNSNENTYSFKLFD